MSQSIDSRPRYAWAVLSHQAPIRSELASGETSTVHAGTLCANINISLAVTSSVSTALKLYAIGGQVNSVSTRRLSTETAAL